MPRGYASRLALTALAALIVLVAAQRPGVPAPRIYAAPAAQEATPTSGPAPQAEAERLRQLGNERAQAEDWPAALELYLQALALYERFDDRAGEAQTRFNIGLVHAYIGANDLAIDSFAEALVLWRDLGDAAQQAKTLVNLGLVYEAQGDRQRQLDAYREALPLQERAGGDPMQLGYLLQDLGTLYYDLRNYEQALPLFEQALTIWQAAGNQEQHALTNELIGASYYSLSDYEHASTALGAALDGWQQLGNRAKEATLHKLLAGNALGLGRLQVALTEYDAARRAFDELGDRAGAAEILGQIGQLYLNVHDYARARSYYGQALDLARADDTAALRARLLVDSGFAAWMGDDEDTAIRFYHEALALWDPTQGSERADTLMKLADVYRSGSKYQQAGAAYEEALPLLRNASDPLKEIIVLRDLALIAGQLEDAPRRDALLSLALERREALTDKAYRALSTALIGVVYLEAGDQPEARRLFEQALALFRAIGDRQAEAALLTNIGWTYEAQGERERALAAYAQAVDVLDSIRGEASIEEIKIGVAAGAAATYRRATLLLVDLGRADEAFTMSERARARALLDQLGATRPDRFAGADPQLIGQEQLISAQIAALDRDLRAERAKPLAQRSDVLIATLNARLIDQQQRYQDVLTRLKLSSPGYAAAAGVAPLGLAEIRQALDDRTALVSYLVTEQRSVAFLVGRDGLKVYELGVGEPQLRAAVTEFRDGPVLQEVPPSLVRLHGWLVTPLLEDLRPFGRVGIIPDGALHAVSMAALTDGTDYFGAGRDLFELPSASVLPYLNGLDAQSRHPAALVLGQGEAPDLPPLRYAQEEAETVGRLLGSAPLLAQHATEASFVAHAPDASIIHVAAHGDLNLHSPLLSRLILAPDTGSDGSLTVQDIYDLELAQTDLVVLSACQTQGGMPTAGGDNLALHRAFLAAGASTVIASLWAVDDAATTTLMERFYVHLADGASKATALRLAQHDLQTIPGHPEYAHPYYWAAFVLTGDPGLGAAYGVDDRNGTIWLLLASATAMTLVMLTLFWRRRASFRNKG